MTTKLLSGLRPGIEVSLRRDIAADPLLGPDRPVLGKSGRADDRRLVDPLRLVDIICTSVALDGPLLRSPAGRVVRAVRLDDVVLDERVLGPAIERHVAVDVGRVPGAVVDDVLGTAGVPALAGHEVADVAPRDLVPSGGEVVVRDAALAVRPEAVED